MALKKIGRIFCGLTMAAAISAAAALSGCTIETKHPRAVITIEFNGTEYAIEYTLYRNMYPQTVSHFIELANSGFYNDTIIHDYTDNNWYGGGYDYIEGEYENAITYDDMDNYLNYDDDDSTQANKENEYIELFKSGALTASVYTDYYMDDNDNMQVDKDSAYWTLRGEFSANGHNIKKGELSASFGTLQMYYTEKAYDSDDNGDKAKRTVVYLKTSNNETVQGTYEYNSATSLFSIQVGSSSDLDEDYYCTFAQLRNSSAEDTLNDLLDAIEDYIDTLGDKDFVQSAEVQIDTTDALSDGSTDTYSVPIEPIIIKSVKITRY